MAPSAVRRFGALRGAALALVAWAASAAFVLPGMAAVPAAKAAAAVPATATGPFGSRPPLRLDPGKVRKADPKEAAVRFVFGAGTSALAGILSVLAGALVGGAFLAFPAILLASLTLLADEEGEAAARNDAKGATAGAIGLIGFAVVGAVFFTRWPTAAAFAVASAAWVVVAGVCYGAAWIAGLGADEPH